MGGGAGAVGAVCEGSVMPSRRVHYIAYRDTARGMVPVHNSQQVRTFPTLEAAREAAGPLGVGVAVTEARLRELEERG